MHDLMHCVVSEDTTPLSLFFGVVFSRSYVHAPQFLALENYKEYQSYEQYSIEYKIFAKLC